MSLIATVPTKLELGSGPAGHPGRVGPVVPDGTTPHNLLLPMGQQGSAPDGLGHDCLTHGGLLGFRVPLHAPAACGEVGGAKSGT